MNKKIAAKSLPFFTKSFHATFTRTVRNLDIPFLGHCKADWSFGNACSQRMIKINFLAGLITDNISRRNVGSHQKLLQSITRNSSYCTARNNGHGAVVKLNVKPAGQLNTKTPAVNGILPVTTP